MPACVQAAILMSRSRSWQAHTSMLCRWHPKDAHHKHNTPLSESLSSFATLIRLPAVLTLPAAVQKAALYEQRATAVQHTGALASMQRQIHQLCRRPAHMQIVFGPVHACPREITADPCVDAAIAAVCVKAGLQEQLALGPRRSSHEQGVEKQHLTSSTGWLCCRDDMATSSQLWPAAPTSRKGQASTTGSFSS